MRKKSNTLPAHLKITVEEATVIIKINKRDSGRGVLVTGDIILTVAHLFDYCEVVRAQGNFAQIIETRTGGLFVATLLAIEPLADIAVLGALECDQLQRPFKSFREKTIPLRLSSERFKLDQPFPVHVFTSEWVRGSATQTSPHAHSLRVEFEKPIKGGTSGSAIVNDAGEIVGLISIGRGTSRKKIDAMPSDAAPAPCPHLALPVWAVQRITKQKVKAR